MLSIDLDLWIIFLIPGHSFVLFCFWWEPTTSNCSGIRAFSWLYAQGSFLVELGGPYAIRGLNWVSQMQSKLFVCLFAFMGWSNSTTGKAFFFAWGQPRFYSWKHIFLRLLGVNTIYYQLSPILSLHSDIFLFFSLNVFSEVNGYTYINILLLFEM